MKKIRFKCRLHSMRKNCRESRYNPCKCKSCPHCYRDFTRPSELRHIKEANCPYCRKRVTFKNK